MSEKKTNETVELELHALHPPKGAVKKGKRRGQGEGSGNGRQGGRGHKGQHSRSGFSRKLAFEGGQMPLVRRIPKRGFTNIHRVEFAEINVDRIQELGEKVINPEVLLSKGVIKNLKSPVKILGNGEIKLAVSIKAHAFTKSAVAKIEAAGGKVEVISAQAETTEAKAEVTE